MKYIVEGDFMTRREKGYVILATVFFIMATIQFIFKQLSLIDWLVILFGLPIILGTILILNRVVNSKILFFIAVSVFLIILIAVEVISRI